MSRWLTVIYSGVHSFVYTNDFVCCDFDGYEENFFNEKNIIFDIWSAWEKKTTGSNLVTVKINQRHLYIKTIVNAFSK